MEHSRIQDLLAPYVPRPLASSQIDDVSRYLALLTRWNQRMNLTAIRQPEEIVRRHFGESLFAASKLFSHGVTTNHRVVDIGSGAGFPGLAMRIYAPFRLTLIESRQRKAAFLREAARVLGFEVEVFNGRAENYPAPLSDAQLTVTLRAVEKFEEALPVAAAILHSWSRERLASGIPGSGRIAILVGSGQTSLARAIVPVLPWSDPIPIPHSRERVLLLAQGVFQT